MTAITPKVDIVERLRIHADAIEDGTPVPYGKMGEVQRRAADEIETLREVVAMMARDYVIPTLVPKHDDVIARAIGNRSNEEPLT